MPDPQAKVYTSDIPFVADQLAELDVLVRFIVDAARNSLNFLDFQDKLNKELKEVRVTRVINVEDFLADYKEGFVVLVRPIPPGEQSDSSYVAGWDESHPADYWVDEEGMPYVYSTKEKAEEAIPTKNYRIIRIMNLKERYESKK